MIIMNFFRAIGAMFTAKGGTAVREREAAVPVDEVKQAGYVATFAKSGTWPFNGK